MCTLAVLQLWRPGAHKARVKVSSELCSFWRLQEQVCFLLFPASRSAAFLGSWPHPPPSQPAAWHLLSIVTAPPLTQTLLCLSCPLTPSVPQDPCDDTEPIWTSQSNSHLEIPDSVTPAKSPLPCEVPGSRTGTPLGLAWDHSAHIHLQGKGMVPAEGTWDLREEVPFQGTPQGPAR